MEFKLKDEILAGHKCPYCLGDTECVRSSEIYPNSDYGYMYRCKPCDAYVGCHEGTKDALGRLADPELRELKKESHKYFDQIWITRLINKIWPIFIPDTSNRKKAYRWLSREMGIRVEDCHIGMFSKEQCEQCITICKRALRKNKQKEEKRA